MHAESQIGVFGYFGGRNLGDDLMLESLLPKLGQDVVLFARDADEVCAAGVSQMDVLTASAPSILRRLPVLKRLVRCGGTIFHDEVGQPGPRVAAVYAMQVGLLAVARLFGAQPALLGIGIGKVERRTTRLALLAALRLSNPVVFRDSVSLERARELGFTRGILGVDLAFVGGTHVDHVSTCVAGNSSIAVSPVDLERYGNSFAGIDQADGWVQLIQASMQDRHTESSVKVLAFKDNERESDIPIARKIVDRLITSGVDATLVSRVDAQAAVENASMVIAARFHAAILGAMSKKPLVLVPYNRKIETLGLDLGIEDAVVDPALPIPTVTPMRADLTRLDERVKRSESAIKELVGQR